MAIVTGIASGVASLTDPNLAGELAFPYLGVAATITIAAASVSIQLPVDATGKLYSAYVVNSNGLAWVNINTAGDAAVAGAANTYLLNSAGVPVIIPVKKLTALVAGAGAQISGIMDSGGAGKICVTGIL
jgi:hypothetical protein